MRARRLLLPFALSLAISASAGIIETVRASFATGSDASAIQQLRAYRTSRGITPEYLEAVSWLARAELASRNYAPAEIFARDIYTASIGQLKSRPLDQEPHLPMALGAAIEIQGELLTAQGRRSEAVSYLQEQTSHFAGTSIVTRIRKNLLLLTLEGKPAPPLENVALPKGRPALLFFWAHWCPDCKAEAPILARIKSEFGGQGLVFLAPTQKYGYAAGGLDAAPVVESAYIEQVRRTFYSGLIESPARISETNFTRYGASTTPTLVLIDSAGIVRLYHPGAMTYAQLQDAVQRVAGVKGGAK